MVININMGIKFDNFFESFVFDVIVSFQKV